MATKQTAYVRFNTITGLVEGANLGSQLGVFSLREYANSSQLTANAQPYIDMALADASVSGGKIVFPPLIITAEQIILADGIYYEGVGAKVSTVVQADGVNKSLFVSTTSKGPTSFLNQCGVSKMTIKKATTTDTIGSGIELNCRMGELCNLEKLQFSNWPQSGIRLNKGGQPVVMRDIHAFGCKDYGIDLRRTPGDIWHMVNLDTISGDNHGKGLIHISGGGAPLEIIHISNVKVEAIVAGTMPCVFDFDGLNGMVVDISNVPVYAITPIPAIFKVSSSTVTIHGGIVRAGGPSGGSVVGLTLLVDDVAAGRQVPYDPNMLGWDYRSSTGIL